MESLIGLAGTLVALAGGAFGVYRFGRSRGFKAAQRSLNDKALRESFELLYAPMAALFLASHVASAQATLSPYLSQRLKRAWSHLQRGRAGSAIRALNDQRKTKETAEVEFGPGFPLEDIKRILSGNEAHADERLLELVSRSDRARYEMARESAQDSAFLTDEEFELFQHIVTTRSKLGATFSPGV